MTRSIIPLIRISSLLAKQDEYLLIRKSLLFTNFPTLKLFSKAIRTVLTSELLKWLHLWWPYTSTMALNQILIISRCLDSGNLGMTWLWSAWDRCCSGVTGCYRYDIAIAALKSKSLRHSHDWTKWHSYIGVIEGSWELCHVLETISWACTNPCKLHVILP